MSEDTMSYNQLLQSHSELEIDHDAVIQKLIKAEFDAKVMKADRDRAFEEKRHLKGRLEVMQEIKELASLYEKAYQAFIFIVGDALENGRDLGINEENIIEVITSALKLYEMILSPVSTISDIEEQNEYATFGSNYNNDQIPF